MKRLITIDEIRGAAGAQEVELSGWNADEVFVAKLRRPGLFEMQMRDGIPNPVLTAVQEMFSGRVSAKGEDAERNAAGAFYHIARVALVSPSMDELEAAGVSLNDRQLTEIYAFVLGGAAAIARFRETVRDGAGEHGQAVPAAAVRADRSGGSTGEMDVG